MAPGDEYESERRPIASRDKRASRMVAGWLAASGVPPNAISMAGMIAGIAAGLALAATAWPDYARAGFAAAAVLMQLRLLANMLDGMVAQQTGVASPAGELFNEVPDRVSDAAAFIGAGYAVGGDPELGFVAACMALFIAYIRAQGKVVGAHQEFCGPMAKQQRVFVLTVAALYCAFAPDQWQDVPGLQPDWGIVAWALCAVILGEAVTVLRRLRRIALALRGDLP